MSSYNLERLDQTSSSDKLSLAPQHVGGIALNIFDLFPSDDDDDNDYEEWASNITSPTNLGGPDALPEPVATEAQRGIQDIQTWLGEKSLELTAA